MNHADKPTTNTGPPPQGVVRFRWQLHPYRHLESDHPVLLAVMNLTPDSFSDGGELTSTSAIITRAKQLADDGADALDLGGESTRPGATPVPERDQIQRVIPAIRAIREAGITLPITIDTTRSAVADAALDAGADAINDVSGGTDDPAMLPLIAQRNVGVVLMHRLTTPPNDSYSTDYTKPPEYAGGVVPALRVALRRLLDRAVQAGIPPSAILLDPGLGFGKTVEQNNELLKSAGTFALGTAGVLIGASRKSFLVTDRPTPPADRDEQSVHAAQTALAAGAMCFRIHNVRAHRAPLNEAFAALRKKLQHASG